LGPLKKLGLSFFLALVFPNLSKFTCFLSSWNASEFPFYVQSCLWFLFENTHVSFVTFLWFLCGRSQALLCRPCRSLGPGQAVTLGIIQVEARRAHCAYRVGRGHGWAHGCGLHLEDELGSTGGLWNVQQFEFICGALW
jgi:hypothetical protein